MIRNYKKTSVFSLIIACLLYGLAYAEDIDVGVVAEMSPDGVFLQVNDKIFNIDGIAIELAGAKQQDNQPSIAEGSLVRIVRGEKTPDFYYVEQLMLYTGDEEKRVRDEMELPAASVSAAPVAPAQLKPAPPKPPKAETLKYKDGMWTN